VAVEEDTFVQLFGLEVRDQGSYSEYRARMTPLLHAHGGAFGIDLEVSRVLKGPTEAALNRVFSIEFPGRAASARFFANEEYRAVRREWFEPAVGRVEVLAEWLEARGAGAPR
jgi:uncharacterized protein (DUF1330 family)